MAHRYSPLVARLGKPGTRYDEPESAHAVYLDGSHGPFRCDHCEYFRDGGACNEEHIIAFAKRGEYGLTMVGPLAKVDPAGCSDYFEATKEEA
jgi:hypothetical protein